MKVRAVDPLGQRDRQRGSEELKGLRQEERGRGFRANGGAVGIWGEEEWWSMRVCFVQSDMGTTRELLTSL